MLAEHRVVVITGAARGLGRTIAQAFLDDGCSVALGDRNWSGEEAQAFRRELGACARALALDLDITSQAQIDDAFERIVSRFARIDVLINNAGMRQRDLFPLVDAPRIVDTEIDQWRQMFEVNLFGTLRVIKRFVRPMVEQRSGSIVNISTSSTDPQNQRPDIRQQPYVASKAALNSLTTYLASDLRASNVAVNAVLPPYMLTTGVKEQVLDQRTRLAQPVPNPLRPEVLVPLVRFLAAQRADNGVTGRVILATEWNLLHGHGAPQSWEAELEA